MLDKIRSTEPAAWAELARGILAALVAAGWVTVDDATVNTVGSAVALVASVVLSRFVRRNVTPVGKLESPEH